jgi:hypothetical protein
MLRTTLILCALITLAACTELEGVFEPACMAFEGDRVVLRDGRFEWHRFTDERRIDDKGNVIESFPGYPITGNYKLSRGKVRFNADSGARLADHYLVEEQGALYLLTAEQYKAVSDGDAIPSCALRRNQEETSN